MGEISGASLLLFSWCSQDVIGPFCLFIGRLLDLLYFLHCSFDRCTISSGADGKIADKLDTDGGSDEETSARRHQSYLTP